MKKKAKKLVLAKETVRTLEVAALETALGGLPESAINLTCPSCECIEH